MSVTNPSVCYVGTLPARSDSVLWRIVASFTVTGHPCKWGWEGMSEPGVSLPTVHLSFPICKSGDLE